MDENREEVILDEEIDEEIDEEEEYFDEVDEENGKSFSWKTAGPILNAIAAILLSIMSIIISVISVMNERESNLILQNDREAYFALNGENISEKSTTERGYDEGIISYTIKNDGGIISGFKIKPYSVLQIYATYNRPAKYDPETKKITDEGFAYSILYNIKLKEAAYTADDKYEAYNYDAYNQKSKEFTVSYRYAKNFFNMLDKAENILSLPEMAETQSRSDVVMEMACARSDCAEIAYCNYKNEAIQQKYSINGRTIAIGGEISYDDVQSKTIAFEFTDFGEEDAERLAATVRMRLRIDATQYEYQQKQALVENK